MFHYYLYISYSLLQIDDPDYTENGVECENKCQWYYDDEAKNTSQFNMKCVDINGTWAHCTPFACKTIMFCTYIHMCKQSNIKSM